MNQEMKQTIVEICCGSYYDAMEAYRGGADRIELNSALVVGGLTPTTATLKLVKEKVPQLPVICMVRPRGAGFCYTEEEFEVMKAECLELLEAGADGIAFGCLKEDATIDFDKNKDLLSLIKRYNKEAVFHRAFDCVQNPFETMEQLIALGVDRVLTSGLKAKAMEGVDRATIEATLTKVMAQQMGMDEKEIAEYLSSMSDEDLTKSYRKLVEQQVKMQYAAQVAQQMAMMPKEQKAVALDAAMETYTTEQCAKYYNEVLVFSDSSYEKNLEKLGYIDLESPSSMNFYASSFENKDLIEEAIAEYNSNVEEVKQIKYTDYVGIMMASITTIIDAITYILIAFVAISLVVSSIMIAVITLISVQERTKEIGILRAMGASKHNVSVMFNAETILIGLASGILGVVVTIILCFPINAIIHAVTDIHSLNAYLPAGAAVILIAISVILNLFSGFIPAKSAARKDPVVALRTE